MGTQHTSALAVALVAVVGCGPGEESDGVEGALLRLQGGGELELRIEYPVEGQVLRGLSPVILSLPYDAAIEVLSLELDDDGPTRVQRPRPVLSLPTRQFPNGEHVLSARVELSTGEVLEHSIEIEIQNALHQLVSVVPDRDAYEPGGTLELALGYSEPGLALGAEFSSLDAGFDDSRVEFEDLGAGSYRLRYQLSSDDSRADGVHLVALSATNGAGETNVDYVPLRSRRAPPIPIGLVGGVFVEGEPPASSDSSDGPVMTSASGGDSLLSGGQLSLDASWSSGESPVDRLLVSVAGYSGYFVKPVSGASDALTLTLPFLPGQSDGAALPVRLAAEASDGTVSNWLDQAIIALVVPQAGVQATLTWNSAADLDLTVRTPSGARIDFENRFVDGGALDLDANSQCTSSLVSAEHVGWPEQERREGPYEVYVNMYDACGVERTEWKLVAQFCGKTELRSGVLEAGQATPGVDGTRELEFEVDCGHAVTGRVEYQTLAGLAGLFSPASFVPVRAVPVGGGEPLAETITDALGNYRLAFPNPDGVDYFVEVVAAWDEPESGEPLIIVTPQGNAVPYAFRSSVVTSDEQNAERDFRLQRDAGGGALSIVNAARRSYSWLIAFVGGATSAGRARVRWEMGSDEVTRYLVNPPDVSISSTARQVDDTDPSVVAHEFMHWAIHQLSFRSDVGGGHFGKLPPMMALQEGLATLYGQTALGSSEYVSLGDFWMIEGLEVPFALREEIDLDDLPANAPEEIREMLRNREGVLDERRRTRTRVGDEFVFDRVDGDVSEWLVAMIGWDLLDPANEGHDRISRRVTAVNHATFFYLSGDVFGGANDRGAAGRDLVDFLDGYLQLRPDDEASVLRLTSEREFPYARP